MKTPAHFRFAAAALLVAIIPTILSGQGPLTPPGGAAPTMKTLDQVEARIIVNAINTPGDALNTFIISAPGSYYLTGNIAGVSGKQGISIQADDVTLDLNGFALVSGGGGAVRGVDVPVARKNLCVRNGTVRGWTDGGVRTDLATSTLAEKLRLTDNVGAIGLLLGNGSARDCVASGNDTGFFLGNGAQINDCAATGNATGFHANNRSQMTNCISTVNTGVGFDCTSFVIMTGCNSSRNGSNGIVVQASCSVINCSSTINISTTGSIAMGISAGDGCTIENCTVEANQSFGILVAGPGGGNVIRNCTSRANAVGIRIAVSTKNRIDGNTITDNRADGLEVDVARNLVIRNNASGNAPDFTLAAGAFGPIVDMTAGGTIASTSPWANFSY